MPLEPAELFEQLKNVEKGDTQFQYLLARICVSIHGQERLRFFLDATPNFGHQANTVFLMKSIIDLVEYKGNIEVYVSSNTKVTLEMQYKKLMMLLPGFDPAKGLANICRYNSCDRISFMDKPSASIAYGFTGGADDPKVNYAALLQVRFFLRLQPYFWKAPNQIEQPDSPPVSLPMLHPMIYQYEMSRIKVVAESVFSFYAAEGFYSKEKMQFAQAIFPLAQGEAVRLWPMYGLHQLRSTSSLVLLLMICAALDADAAKDKPIAIVLFNAQTDDHLELLRSALTMEQNEFEAVLVEKIVEYYPNPKAKERISGIAKEITAKIFFYKASMHLYEEVALLAGIPVMQAKRQGIFVFQCGGMPADIFNCFYAHADMPSVYEGQGTASLAINTGKPFCQLSINSPWKYAELPINSGDKCNIDQLLSDYSGSFPNLFFLFINKCLALSDFIKNGYVESALKIFFNTLSEYTRNPKNDKLKTALVLFGAYVESLPKETALYVALDAPDRLKQLRDKMVCTIVDGKLDLLKALEQTYIGEIYKRLMNGCFAIEAAATDIVLTETGGEAILRIADKKIAFMDMDFAMWLTFNFRNNSLQSSMQIALPAPVEIPGIPWIVFSETGMAMTVYENGLPMEAAFCTQVPGLDARLSIDFPRGQKNWCFHSTFLPPMSALTLFYQMTGGLNFLAQFPESLQTLGSWGMSSMRFIYDAEKKAVSLMEFVMTTAKPWKIPLVGEHCLSFKPSVMVSVYQPQDLQNRALVFQVSGQFVFDHAILLIEGKFPHFSLQARLLDGTISLSALLASFGATIDLKTNITAFSMALTPEKKEYQLNCQLETDWTLFKVITIKELKLDLQYSAGNADIYLSGRTILFPGTADLDVRLIAQYKKSGGISSWEIEGVATCAHLLDKLFGVKLEICNLAVKFNTLKDERLLMGGIKGKWVLPFGDLQAAATVLVFSAPEQMYCLLEANVLWENIHIMVKGRYEKNKCAFSLKWGVIEGEIKQEGEDWVASLRLTESFSIGKLVETMVAWVAGHPFGLDAPWDILNSITLSGTTIQYNFSKKTVSLEQTITRIDLGVAAIDGIKLSYEEKQNKQKGVMVSLLGSFPWNAPGAMGNANSLGPWDASEPGTAPVPNGSGNKYFDLTLLALGQHVEIPGTEEAKTAQTALECMRALCVPEAGELPDIRYKATNGWLIGAEFSLIKLTGKDESGYMVLVQTVFNDPQLYALRVKLQGAASKVFAGLDVQILYRKVSDTVGVYESEITLPDYIRYLSIGAYSITLPIISIAAYTNGDFKIDLGFPWNHDFTRSFTFEGMIGPIPFIGSAGLYFAKLSGETSVKVPKAINGQFNPVIEFGIGLKFGIGKSVQLGPLKAGFSLTVIGVLEGVIAKWNPYQQGGSASPAQLQDSYFYKINGLVGIVGNLYGTVDFCIVKASINIMLEVYVQFEVGSYQDTIFTVEASVRVEASLSVDLFLFQFTISFTFSAKIKETFVIANHDAPPWICPNAYTGVLTSGNRLSQYTTPLYAFAKTGALCWSRLQAPPAKQNLDAYLALAPTVVKDEWNTGKILPCYVAMLMLDADKQQENSFSIFAKTVLRWLFAATQPKDLAHDACDDLIVDEMTLQRLRDDYLLSTDAQPLPIPQEAISHFLLAQFLLQVHTAADKESQKNTAYFPMLPELTLTVPAYGSDISGSSYSFGDYNHVSEAGVREIRKYFEELAIQVQEESEQDARICLAADAAFSLGDLAFCDYFLLVARQMVEAALAELRCYTYALTRRETPQEILTWISCHRQDAEEPYTLLDLFSANEEKLLSSGRTLAVTTGAGIVFHCTGQDETLLSMLRKYNTSMASLVEHAQNAEIEALFLPGNRQTLSIPHLRQFRMRELLKKIDTQNIAGMVSRYCLHGMRLETKSITPIARGMWVSGKNKLPDMAGLHAMTGQQFQLPDDFCFGDFSISLCRPEAGCALVWCDLPPGKRQFTMTIQPNSNDAKRIVDLVSWARSGQAKLPEVKMNSNDMCIAKDVVYTLSAHTPVISENAISLPYGQSDNQSLKLWNLPLGMIKKGKYSLQIIRYNESSGQTIQTQGENFGWVTRIDFKVKKTQVPCCYELFGASAASVERLEGLLNQPEDMFKQLILGFPSKPRQNDLMIDPQENITAFLGKANLSTDTNPGDLCAKSAVVEASSNFIKRLWEALITNQGGFYLYYQRVTDKNIDGIPDASFNEQGEADLSLLVIYKEAPLPLTNGILTDEFMPDGQANLAVKAESRSVQPVQEETLIYQSTVSAGSLVLSCIRPNKSNDQSMEAKFVQNYNLLTYQIEANQDFVQSPLSLPMSGTSPNKEVFAYKAAIPYAKFSRQAAKNPYACIGKTLAIRYDWQDYYGNQLAAAQHRTFLTGYTDSLIGVSSWPSLNLSWTVDSSLGGAMLCLIFSFDPTRFEEDTQAARRAAGNALNIYRQLEAQLRDPNGVVINVHSSLFAGSAKMLDQASLRSWLFDREDSICQYLEARARGVRTPVGCVDSFSAEFPLRAEWFEEQEMLPLTCAVSIERKHNLVMSGFEQVQDIASTSAFILPQIKQQKRERMSMEPLSLEAFAANVERVFVKEGDYRFLLTVSGENKLFAIKESFSKGKGLQVSFCDNAPVVLIPRPFSNVLESRREPIAVPTYASGAGLCLEVTEPVLFFNIDIDVWIRELLQAVDALFSPELLGGIMIVDSRVNGAHFDELIALKKELAAYMSTLLIPVFSNEKSAHLPEAKSLLKQHMLRQLANFYHVHAILSYDAKVRANLPEKARLCGIIRSTNQGDFQELTLQPSKIMLKDDDKAAFLCLVHLPEIAKNKDGGIIPSLTLKDLTFQGTHIEHAIQHVSGMGDYESSRWQRFVLDHPTSALLVQSLPEVQLPIVLRLHPANPSLIGQREAKESVRDGAPLGDWMGWTYEMTYSRDIHYPQDSLECFVAWNVQNYAKVNSSRLDYFAELAKFTKLYPAIQGDVLKFLLGMRTDAAIEQVNKVDKALQAFEILVKNIVTALTAPKAVMERSGTREKYAFMLQEGVGDEQELVVYLTEHNASMPSNAKNPIVVIEGYQTESIAVCPGYAYRFKDADGKFLTATVGQKIAKRSIRIPKLNLLTYQNALATVNVYRNRNLLHNRVIDASFVYKTGEISFENPLYVSRDIDEAIDITAFGQEQSASIDAHLRYFFDILFSGDCSGPVQIQMECQYGYQTNQNASSIEIPVFMQLPTELARINMDTMIKNWTRYIENWRENASGILTWNKDNFLKFNCNILSTMTENPTRLLSMHNLILPGQKISDKPTGDE